MTLSSLFSESAIGVYDETNVRDCLETSVTRRRDHARRLDPTGRCGRSVCYTSRLTPSKLRRHETSTNSALLAFTVATLLTACGQHSQSPQTSSINGVASNTSPQDASTGEPTSAPQPSLPPGSNALRVVVDGQNIPIDEEVRCFEGGYLPGSTMISQNVNDPRITSIQVSTDRQGAVTSVAIIPGGRLLEQPGTEYGFTNPGNTARDAVLTKDGNGVHVEGHVTDMIAGGMKAFTIDLTCP